MYKPTLLLFAAGIALSEFANAGEGESQVSAGWNPMRANYMIHSGGATYPEPPTNADRALTVHFEGKAAKEVFDQIGPDAKVKCSSEKGDRERRKNGVSCVYTAHLNDPRDFHYTCWVGINLRTGDGDVRISC
jgi:hypothetical protein